MTARATATIDGNTLILSGVLDYESVVELDAQGQQWLHGSAPDECAVDLAGVTYSSSVGLALLLGWLRIAHQQHKKLHILALPANMSALAEVSGLENLLVG